MTEWRGREEVKAAMRRFGEDLKQAKHQLALEWVPILEAYAKQNARWDDRTTNARQSLFSVVDSESGKTTIYLSHGMSYGVYLELLHQGRFAIILATLEAHYEPIQASYRRMLGGNS